MTQPGCFWEDIYHAVEAGGRVEGILEPSRALLLFDTKAGDLYHLYIKTDKAWANHVAIEIEAVMSSFRLARLGRAKLHVHIYGDALVDEERLETLSFQVAAKVRLDRHTCGDEQDETRFRSLALALDKQRKAELKKRFSFGEPQLVYALMMLTFVVMWLAESLGSTLDPNTLIRFGAKVNPLIDDGEWWRLVTPMFLHIGWFHFAINMFALWSLGPLVERMYGSPRFLTIYLLAGVIASTASYAFSEAISAGASGALFGLVGALLYFGLRDRSLFMKTLGPPLFIMLGLNVGLAFVLGASLDHSAHAGGLIGGFLMAGVVGLPDETTKKWRLLFTVLAIGLTGTLYWLGYNR
ncbi:rhomboid family intramembrane serine protease [Exiguobacterium sp. SH5S13]|uniref:rhomboid family intramembrane serine protease n=1 Tax=unclassified Exiguobacterium TaxID=2644629 RepID=UPI0010409C7C|nr:MULTISPECIES: rhomboid family intramembrane serine protease [unclassified Exiguobacterium]TCI24662.1 rhomboid family intramembrane serine protease [Exiguobacterium sp. SH5S4]TCI56999.1 rhomboid family intramembrane serine protease [Exiguobacterium sp. SH5S13]